MSSQIRTYSMFTELLQAMREKCKRCEQFCLECSLNMQRVLHCRSDEIRDKTNKPFVELAQALVGTLGLTVLGNANYKFCTDLDAKLTKNAHLCDNCCQLLSISLRCIVCENTNSREDIESYNTRSFIYGKDLFQIDTAVCKRNRYWSVFQGGPFIEKIFETSAERPEHTASTYYDVSGVYRQNFSIPSPLCFLPFFVEINLWIRAKSSFSSFRLDISMKDSRMGQINLLVTSDEAEERDENSSTVGNVLNALQQIKRVLINNQWERLQRRLMFPFTRLDAINITLTGMNVEMSSFKIIMHHPNFIK